MHRPATAWDGRSAFSSARMCSSGADRLFSRYLVEHCRQPVQIPDDETPVLRAARLLVSAVRFAVARRRDRARSNEIAMHCARVR